MSRPLSSNFLSVERDKERQRHREICKERKIKRYRDIERVIKRER
jgi:hypothetical protein